MRIPSLHIASRHHRGYPRPRVMDAVGGHHTYVALTYSWRTHERLVRLWASYTKESTTRFVAPLALELLRYRSACDERPVLGPLSQSAFNKNYFSTFQLTPAPGPRRFGPYQQPLPPKHTLLRPPLFENGGGETVRSGLNFEDSLIFSHLSRPRDLRRHSAPTRIRNVVPTANAGASIRVRPCSFSNANTAKSTYREPPQSLRSAPEHGLVDLPAYGLNRGLPTHDAFINPQKDYIRGRFDLTGGEPAAPRGADAIVDFLRMAS